MTLLFAQDRASSSYIIEMQVGGTPLTDKIGFAKRVVYYSAKSCTSQPKFMKRYKTKLFFHTFKWELFGFLNPFLKIDF